MSKAKTKNVEALKARVSTASTAVLTEKYRGLTERQRWHFRKQTKAVSAKYKAKHRLARIALKDSQTMAFLHARGLDVEPKGLATALRAAIAETEALYRAKPGREGLTAEEVEAARSGGLDSQPARGARADPLVQGVAAYASLIHTGLTARQAAARLGVSDARVRQRLQARTLLAVREGRSWKLPVFQFTKRGELPGWSEVCPSLPSATSPVAAERWLALPHPDLVTGANETPISPRAWLLEGRPPEAVAALAGELA